MHPHDGQAFVLQSQLSTDYLLATEAMARIPSLALVLFLAHTGFAQDYNHATPPVFSADNKCVDPANYDPLTDPNVQYTTNCDTNCVDISQYGIHSAEIQDFGYDNYNIIYYLSSDCSGEPYTGVGQAFGAGAGGKSCKTPAVRDWLTRRFSWTMRSKLSRCNWLVADIQLHGFPRC